MKPGNKHHLAVLKCGLLAWAALGVAACDHAKPKPLPQVERVAPLLPPNSSEAWASQPVETWPQIILSNEARFKASTPLLGASAFLVKAKSGRVFAATARHLLGENGGVKPPVPRTKLDAALDRWMLFPRTEPDKTITVEGLGMSVAEKNRDDWLLLRVAEPLGGLPATPLRFRQTPVQVGEQVHLVGVAYAEPAVRQKVYSGKVTQRAYGNSFRYDISPPVDLRGFSGAPILDEAGLVVGVMTVWFEPKMQGEKMLEAGGEDAATVFAEMDAR